MFEDRPNYSEPAAGVSHEKSAAAESSLVMNTAGTGPLAIAIHGGAGVIDRARMSPEREAAYLAGLGAALDAGYGILEAGGTSLHAVTEAVRILEDDPQFNAGRGAVLNYDGEAELDASIMDGTGPRAGAVAGVRHVKNPILLARLVMDQSPHVMLISAGAEKFAQEKGLEWVPNTYFRTAYREQELRRAQQKDFTRAAPGADPGTITGTVGAVALDRARNLAAATSTGGMTNKRYGRVGDSPIIGAGTYANNETCAVSATGAGELFIRGVVAHDIHALVLYKQLSIGAAAKEAIHVKLERAGGRGGVVAIDREGRIALEYNSEGMFRGARDSNGRREVAM